MRFFTIVATLAGLVSALPEPVPKAAGAAAAAAAEAEVPAHAILGKRYCNVNCVTYCCQQVGCNGSLHCSASYCYTNAGGYSWCECKCQYN